MKKACVLLPPVRLILAVSMQTPLFAQSAPVKCIVLVHGAWVDGSGWKSVYDILVKDGYSVSAVQEPLTSFAEDVAATHRILAQQHGPCLLVGHSYGGSVITEAGPDSQVVGLVYVAAHMPDVGESEAADSKRYPSDLAKSDFVKTTPDGYNYLDRLAFPPYFAADLPLAQAQFEAASQIPTAVANFTSQMTKAAWRTKPSWMIVAGADRVINPELERWYAGRAHSRVSEIAGASHSVYESHSNEVAAVIVEAAHTLSKKSNRETPSFSAAKNSGAHANSLCPFLGAVFTASPTRSADCRSPSAPQSHAPPPAATTPQSSLDLP